MEVVEILSRVIL